MMPVASWAVMANNPHPPGARPGRPHDGALLDYAPHDDHGDDGDRTYCAQNGHGNSLLPSNLSNRSYGPRRGAF